MRMIFKITNSFGRKIFTINKLIVFVSKTEVLSKIDKQLNEIKKIDGAIETDYELRRDKDFKIASLNALSVCYFGDKAIQVWFGFRSIKQVLRGGGLGRETEEH